MSRGQPASGGADGWTCSDLSWRGELGNGSRRTFGGGNGVRHRDPVRKAPDQRVSMGECRIGLGEEPGAQEIEPCAAGPGIRRDYRCD